MEARERALKERLERVALQNEERQRQESKALD